MWVFSAIGRVTLGTSQQIGGLSIVLGQIVARICRWQFDGPETWYSLYKVGVRSYPIVIMTALFTGAIMVIQSGQYVRQTGATGFLGWGAGYAVLAEVGPVLIGLMFSGRVGANNTAELGTMKVTEQIDALRALAIDPLAHLVVPRFLAMVVMLFLLTILGDLFALIGGALTSELILNVDYRIFFRGVMSSHLLDEFLIGLVKATSFGAAISVISCYYGLQVSGGAAGVGRAVNNAVVSSAIAIFVWDYSVTFLWFNL